MKNGSVYVAVVFAVLIGYFGYQAWLNPARAVKRRLGEVAATLSTPAGESQMSRVVRLAQLRRYLAENIHVRAGTSGRELTSRDQVLAIAAVWKPSEGGWDVHFADLHITVESEAAARAYLTVEVTTPDPQGRPSVDARDATFALARQNGEWVITEAEAKDLPPHP
jgi:SnoaL-like protein